MIPEKLLITDWLFAAGDGKECLEHAQSVRVPHTWSIDEAGRCHGDVGWYRAVIPAAAFTGCVRAFLRFHAVCRDVIVFVNGRMVGCHNGSGYTPFTLEITSALRMGEDAEVTVRADNRFSEAALPFERSFDWASDGGIIRPVELLLTGASRIRDCAVHAKPLIQTSGERRAAGMALFGFDAEIDGDEGATLVWSLARGADHSVTPVQKETVLSGSAPCGQRFRLAPVPLKDIVFWHFDAPEMYTLTVTVLGRDGSVSDRAAWAVGFRELQLAGASWYLNGERVRLPGMEWMPGSDPARGMAESAADREKMLRLLRESNSVLTRFHWQQDDAVFDWCDRHGILVQEELPYWGKMPEGDPERLWPIVTMQLEEMIRAHRNHPCIISWGVGNELSGHTWPVQRYVRKARAFIRALDPERMVNYVTNTAWKCPSHDAACEGDVMMINDYIGTWEPKLDQRHSWDELLAAHPGRAFLPSEFGLCEPAFSGGDAERERIFLAKTGFYRSIPSIVGTIYFCLNDYRTHMGEAGDGRLCRRVHGSVSLTGEPKPSYYTVRREHAPLTVTQTAQGLLLTCRGDLPCYSVVGYTITDGGKQIPIPALKPGESWLCGGLAGRGVSIYRPNGDLMLTIEQKGM